MHKPAFFLKGESLMFEKEIKEKVNEITPQVVTLSLIHI